MILIWLRVLEWVLSVRGNFLPSFEEFDGWVVEF